MTQEWQSVETPHEPEIDLGSLGAVSVDFVRNFNELLCSHKEGWVLEDTEC